MDYKDVKAYETKLQHKTNLILKQNEESTTDNSSFVDEFEHTSTSPLALTSATESNQAAVKKGYFASWWS